MKPIGFASDPIRSFVLGQTMGFVENLPHMTGVEWAMPKDANIVNYSTPICRNHHSK